MNLSLGLLSIKLNETLVTQMIIILHRCTRLFFSVSQQCLDVKFTGINGRTPSSSMYPKSAVKPGRVYRLPDGQINSAVGY